ncbi:MAG: hypothetical protein V4727_13935 [Verrucomicrobiota bacterium]
MYKQPIIVFGIVIPLIISGVIFGISSVVREKFVTSYDEKASQYKGHQISKKLALETETQVLRQREAFQEWSQILEQDPFSLLRANLRTVGEKLPPKEFQPPLPERLNNKLGFGMASAQDSIALRFNLRGTYRTVQKALLELETRMPNLQLQDLRMDPNSNSDASLLSVQVTYTAWEK